MLISCFWFSLLPKKVIEVQFYPVILHNKLFFFLKPHGFPVSYRQFMLKMGTLRKYEGVATAASYVSTFNSDMEPLVRGSSVPRMNANNRHNLFSVI